MRERGRERQSSGRRCERWRQSIGKEVEREKRKEEVVAAVAMGEARKAKSM
jgi:hypothetical protein